MDPGAPDGRGLRGQGHTGAPPGRQRGRGRGGVRRSLSQGGPPRVAGLPGNPTRKRGCLPARPCGNRAR
eukprot:2315637-Lingulodinium_polyedra.AAC.1